MKKRLTALISSVALTALLAFGAKALELEKPENADELSTGTPQITLMATPITDPELGILIYTQAFDENTTPTYINTDYDINGVNTDMTGLALNDGVLTSTGATGAYRQFFFQYKDISGSGSKFYPRSGIYTTTFDMRNDTASTSDVTELQVRYQGSSHHGGLVPLWLDHAALNSNKGEWQKFKASFVFVRNADDTFTTGLAGSIPSVVSNPGERIYQFRIYAKNAESVSIDNIQLWYFPANAYVLRDGDNYSFNYHDSGDFTFGSPENAENFVGWVSTDGKVYAAGAVIAAADVSTKLLGKTFTAYYQDATMPAMGMAFEGTSDKTVNYNTGVISGDSNVKETTYVTEDGRTAVRVYCENGRWNPRFHALAETPFDPEEYTIVQYVYKAEQGQNTAGTDITGSTARLLYWTSPEDNGFWVDGEHKISGNDISIAVDKEWKTLTYDMSDPANGIAAHPWNKTGHIYGISASPLRAQALSISYIDAIRVYRKGVVTVTYDTNAPKDAEVTKSVAADTNRGVGTGYYLSSDIPVVEGYDFAGWALTPDAGEKDVVTKINLTGDTTVYAVWVNRNAPITSDMTSVRTTDVTGIRFRASVYSKVMSYDNVEIGFLVTRDNDENHAIMDENTPNGKLTLECADPAVIGNALKGEAYKKVNGEVSIDRMNDESDGIFSTYTACMVGIPEGYYDENLLVRPYIQIGETAYYGAEKSESLYNAAKNSSDQENETIKKIIEAVERK